MIFTDCRRAAVWIKSPYLYVKVIILSPDQLVQNCYCTGCPGSNRKIVGVALAISHSASDNQNSRETIYLKIALNTKKSNATPAHSPKYKCIFKIHSVIISFYIKFAH